MIVFHPREVFLEGAIMVCWDEETQVEYGVFYATMKKQTPASSAEFETLSCPLSDRLILRLVTAGDSPVLTPTEYFLWMLNFLILTKLPEA